MQIETQEVALGSDEKLNRSIRSFKIEFHLEDEEDCKIYKKFNHFRELANVASSGPKVRPGDIFKAGLKLLKDADIKKIKEARFSPEDQLRSWANSYNQKHGTSFSPTEFAVQVLPKIKMRELKTAE